MCSKDKEITLEIENTPITCSKETLISNSDYFKAMFEGDFIEKDCSLIKLEDVDLKSMNIILTSLWDESYVVPDEDLLLVLYTACMLQFIKIRTSCLDRIIERLCPKNCIKIWCVTEQLDIRPLFLKAKTMALEEFLAIKDTDSIFELNIKQVVNYLGHINLRTDNEMSVFQTVIRWWYENSEEYIENSTKVLTKLLSCIDFRNLSEDHVKEIMVYPDIANNPELTQILSCILLLKSDKSIEDFPEICRRHASLLYESRSRISSKFPCILANFVGSDGKNKRVKMSHEQQYQIIYHDYTTAQFKKFFHIDGKKCYSLDGFKLVGYKEFVFMYGGEFLIGKGNWNHNFWVYDTIRERWERKCLLPFPRRHFQTCLVGDILYIVGGTGVFRVIQENMFWYSYKENKWSSQMALPCPGRQLRCCSFLNQLFILNVNIKCGFFFDDKTFHWLKIDVKIDDELISNETEFAIFSYRSKLYMKGKSLIEFEYSEKEISVKSVKELSNIVCDKMEIVLCDNVVYTLYKYRGVDNDSYCLESYNLETGTVNFLFKDVSSEDAVIDINGDKYSIFPNLKVFSFHHCSLVEKNSLVNSCFA